MVRIVITSKAELRILQSKLRSLKNTLPQLQKLAIDKAANEVVLDEIKTEMSANDFSDKIIDGTFVGRTDIVNGKSRTHFISEYQADNGFDVANAREEGTRQTQPITPNKPAGSLRIPIPGGGFIFRKFSRPEGMPRLLIIERVLKRAENTFAEKYRENFAASVSKFLGGT